MLSSRAHDAITRTRAARARLDAMLADRRRDRLDDPQDVPTLDEMVDAHVRHVLALTGGNKSLAARLLGVHRSRIRRLAKRALAVVG